MESKMVDTETTNTAESTTATPKRRGRKGNGAATAARKARKVTRAPIRQSAVRNSYKQEVELLRAENARLRAKIESRPGSSLEPELIVGALSDSYSAGLKTGLLLQGK